MAEDDKGEEDLCSLVARIELPEDPPPELNFDTVQSLTHCPLIAVQPHRICKLNSLSESRRSGVSKADRKEVEDVAVVSLVYLAHVTTDKMIVAI